jgi:hypothetical protein
MQKNGVTRSIGTSQVDTEQASWMQSTNFCTFEGLKQYTMEENMPPIAENNANKSATVKETNPVKKKKLKPSQIFMIILVGLVILLPLGVYFFMNLEISKLEYRQKQQTDSLRAQTTLEIRQNNEANLKTVAKVFSWAVRAEMLRDNMEQVDQIMTELVKVKPYQQVVLVSNEGKVLLSTDKKYEEKTYTEQFYQQIAGSDQVEIKTQTSGELLVSAPVYGIDARLGSIVITYKTDEVSAVAPVTDKKE